MEELNQQDPQQDVSASSATGEPADATGQASSASASQSTPADAQPADAGQQPASSGSTGESPTGEDAGSTTGADAPDSRAIARGAVSVGDIFSVVIRDTHVTVVGRDGYVIIRDNEVTANDAA